MNREPLPPSFAIVIGASAGGVEALLTLAKALPADLPAVVCIVLHVGAQPSLLPELLSTRGPLRAVHAQDGQAPLPGTIYVAPPDHHLLLERDTLRLTRGPKENCARPAVDPLFRSAALSWGERAIGVVLSGQLDDGAAGLAAIKDAGGIALVQDPATALEPGMPRAALDSCAVDACLPPDTLAARLAQLAGTPFPPHPAPRRPALIHEVAINRGERTVENLERIATPSGLTCPERAGGLWEVTGARPLRYRCHVGHAYSAQTLVSAQADSAEDALWSSMRALRERAMLLRRLAGVARGLGDDAQAVAGEKQAGQVEQQLAVLMELAESTKSEGGSTGPGG